MRILVTGGTGLLGATLVPWLRAQGHAVVSLGRTREADRSLDLADRVATEELLTELDPEAVVHLAALSDVDACERDLQGAFRANVLAAEHLAAWLRPRPERTLVHLSTDQLYAEPGESPEWRVTISNAYGMSKYAGELAALSVGATVLRTNFFGPSRCPGRLSQSDWFAGSLARGEAITLFEDMVFNPLHMDTVAAMVNRVLEGPRVGVFNLMSHAGMSKADFAEALAGVLGLSTSAARRGASTGLARLARRPLDTRGDPRRFEAAFGVRLPTLAAEIARLGAD